MFVLSAIVMYDAANVRLEAGKHAQQLNRIMTRLLDMNIDLDSKEKEFKELLGHTPLQVFCGALLGLGIGFLLGRILRLPRPKSVALSIEVGMQNSGLASSLAVLHFAAYPLATIPGAVFSVWHNISGALAAKLFLLIGKNEKE